MVIALAVACVARSPIYQPPPAVARCLAGSQLFAAGPSELANILGWLTGGEVISTRANTDRMKKNEATQQVEQNRLAAARSLSCTTRRNLGDRHWQCAGSYRRRAHCREDLYARRPFEANCSGWRGPGFSVTFRWKSFAYSTPDDEMRAAIARALAADDDRHVLVVLSQIGGVQFNRFGAHRESMLHNVRDDEPWPQEWIDDYVNQTQRLLTAFAPSALHQLADSHPRRDHAPQRRRRRRLCVVWRTQNIASRHANASEPRHHPSSANGVHHWLSRIAIALARQAGIGTVDMTNVTMRSRPLSYSADGRGSKSPSHADALEGDVYHGYPSSFLGPLFLQALSRECCGAAIGNGGTREDAYA